MNPNQVLLSCMNLVEFVFSVKCINTHAHGFSIWGWFYHIYIFSDRTHRRTGSDPFSTRITDIASTLENIINRRGMWTGVWCQMLNTHKPDVVDCGLKDWHKVLTRSTPALSWGKKKTKNNNCCRQICASRETIWYPTESAFFLHLLPNSDLRQWCDNNISAENYMRTSDTKMTTEQR